MEAHAVGRKFQMGMLPENPGIVETRRKSRQTPLAVRLYVLGIVSRENVMDRVDLYMHAIHKETCLPTFPDSQMSHSF